MVCSRVCCALRHDRTHRFLLAIFIIRRGEADTRRGDEEALQAARQREAQLSSSLQVLRLASLCPHSISPSGWSACQPAPAASAWH